MRQISRRVTSSAALKAATLVKLGRRKRSFHPLDKFHQFKSTSLVSAPAAASASRRHIGAIAATLAFGAFVDGAGEECDWEVYRGRFLSASQTAMCKSAKNVVEKGSRVGLRFLGRDAETGEVLVKLEDAADPISFIVGKGKVLPGIEDAIIGKTPGDKFSITIENAYGEHHSKWLKTMPRDDKIPEDIAVGERLELSNGRGRKFVVVVVEVGENSIRVDGNHPLAGKTLTFEVDVETVDPPLEPVSPTDEIKAGNGKDFPTEGDTVTISYVGTLESTGDVFDSSRDRGKPIVVKIGVGQVIKGWDEGVMRMSLGQRAVLRIPSEKAYGSRGAGGVIPPNSNLIFDVELHRIERSQSGGGKVLNAPGYSP